MGLAMDAINKYLSPLSDIGADIWNAEETPDFPLPLKKKEPIIPEINKVADDAFDMDDADEIEQKDSLPKVAQDASIAGAENRDKSEDGYLEPVVLSDTGEESVVELNGDTEKDLVIEPAETENISDAVVLNQTVDQVIEKIVEPPKQADETSHCLSDSARSTSFVSTLRIVSRNDDAIPAETDDGIVAELGQGGQADSDESADSREDPLFVAHVVAPLAKTIGSLAYRYHLTLSLDTEERELRALLGCVRGMAASISSIFKQSGVTAIGLAPRFMYVSRPIVQQAYDLYHAPLSDTYFARLQHIVDNLAHFSLRLFPQNWHVGELDAHDRLDVFEALSPVVVALGQSADDKTETLVKDVCQTLLNKVQGWCARTENGVYSDNARMLARFSSLFSDIYLTEVERFSNLEPREKHIYLNAYNQAPSLPIIWDLFDKKVEMLRKISDSTGNSFASRG